MTRKKRRWRRKQGLGSKGSIERGSSVHSTLFLKSTRDNRLVLCSASDTRLSLAPIPSALIGLGMLSSLVPGHVNAADTVVSVSPLNASHTAAVTTDVSATLTGAETSGLSPQTFVVHASQTARTGTNGTSGGGTAVITVDPFNDFHPGERVQATVTGGVQTAQGGVAPYVWDFRTQVSGGIGSFLPSSNSFGNSVTMDVALGDLDGDGDLDAFVPHDLFRPNRVLLNNGSGLFTDSGNSLGDSRSLGVALGDLDGDGDLDAFVANGNNVQSVPNRVWLNDGSGIFTLSSNSLGSSHSTAVALGDVDGDGDLDAFVANSGGLGQPNRVWLNDGSGTFTLSSNSLGSSISMAVALGDVDGDGDLDAWVVNNNDELDRVWLNDGSGLFTDSGNSLSGGFFKSDVALGDLDGDGDLDAFVTHRDSRWPNRVWLNDGSGTFTLSSNSLGSSDSFDVALGDVDGDGDLDAFVANSCCGANDESNRVWLNDGSGTFTLSSNSLGSSHSRAVELGDLDGDGDLDAFVANAISVDPGQPNQVWMNALDSDGDGIFDSNDNCPNDANPGQENLDSDGFGNVCDPDVDGDGLLNAADPDDDNDGLSDIDEALAGTDPVNPDTDDDGIVDGLDRDPLMTVNNLCFGMGADATFTFNVTGTFTCAASNSIAVDLPAGVDPGGDLWLISPTVTVNRITVKTGGKLTVKSQDPTSTDP